MENVIELICTRVRFYFRGHPPTHFHAFYGEFEAQIKIETGAIRKGRLPKTAYDLVNTWRMSLDPPGGWLLPSLRRDLVET